MQGGPRLRRVRGAKREGKTSKLIIMFSQSGRALQIEGVRRKGYGLLVAGTRGNYSCPGSIKNSFGKRKKG